LTNARTECRREGPSEAILLSGNLAPARDEDEPFTYQMVGDIVPERRDDRRPSTGQSNRSAVLTLLTAIVAALIVFGGFYLFDRWKSSTALFKPEV